MVQVLNGIGRYVIDKRGDYLKVNETMPTLYEGDEERELQADLERLQSHLSDRDGAREFVEGGGTCVY